jgi:hypothetical protein
MAVRTIPNPLETGRWYAKIIQWNFLRRGEFQCSHAVCHFRTQLGPSREELSRDGAHYQDRQSTVSCVAASRF